MRGKSSSLAASRGFSKARVFEQCEPDVGGKIAQMGSRLIDSVAKGMADKFFASFAAACGAGA